MYFSSAADLLSLMRLLEILDREGYPNVWEFCATAGQASHSLFPAIDKLHAMQWILHSNIQQHLSVQLQKLFASCALETKAFPITVGYAMRSKAYGDDHQE